MKLINKLLVSLLVAFAVIGFASATPMNCQKDQSCNCCISECSCCINCPGNCSYNITMKIGDSKTIPAKKWAKIEPKLINSLFFKDHFSVTKNDDGTVTITAIKAGHAEFDIRTHYKRCHVVVDIVE